MIRPRHAQELEEVVARLRSADQSLARSLAVLRGMDDDRRRRDRLAASFAASAPARRPSVLETVRRLLGRAA